LKSGPKIKPEFIFHWKPNNWIVKRDIVVTKSSFLSNRTSKDYFIIRKMLEIKVTEHSIADRGQPK
jgi:hypothetical protein